MLKGINNYFSHAELLPFSTSASVNEMNSSLRDSINQQYLPHHVQPVNSQIISHSGQKDSAFKAPVKISSVIMDPKDTSATLVYPERLPFQITRTAKDEQYFNNFLLGIAGKNISGHYKFKDQETSGLTSDTTRTKLQTTVVQVPKQSGFIGTKRNVSIDWVPGFLLLSLFVFSWMKILYQKYIVQVVSSSINYQASIRLLREKNVLFQNMALGLNFVFAINAGLFLHYLLVYFNLALPFSQIESVFILSLGVILLYNTKTLVCRILGNIFLVKEDFTEYIHNINLFNKNIGLFLFPIVVSFPYVDTQVKPFLLYLGIIVVICFFILGLSRGIQIIIRKGASIFFLIMYLCAVEILPVLLLVKATHTLI